MLDFYYWPTPNGWKVSILLEELRDAIGLDYTLKPVNIGKGEQFDPAFLAISPNHRMPALVDHDPPDGWGPVSEHGPVTIFESGAIMLYLAEKHDRFLAPGPRGRARGRDVGGPQVGRGVQEDQPPVVVVGQRRDVEPGHVARVAEVLRRRAGAVGVGRVAVQVGPLDARRPRGDVEGVALGLERAAGELERQPRAVHALRRSGQP